MAVADKNVFASTVDEFIAGAGKLFRGDLGQTTPRVTHSFTSTGGKIDSLTLSIVIDSATAHWAGPGVKDGKQAPQPDAANRVAINQVEALNRSHEQKHVDGYQDTFDNKKDAIEKSMIGKPQSQSGSSVTQMNAELKKVCEALHRSEGNIDVTPQGNGFIVTTSARGPGGCG